VAGAVDAVGPGDPPPGEVLLGDGLLGDSPPSGGLVVPGEVGDSELLGRPAWLCATLSTPENTATNDAAARTTRLPKTSERAVATLTRRRGAGDTMTKAKQS
jgi:hypothetical protein